jgi:phage-related protein
MQLVYHDEVKKFILTLQKPTQSNALRVFDLLETYGLQVDIPHIKKVTKRLYELRIRGEQEVRLFFVVHTSIGVLVHGFIKKSQKTSQSELQIAEKRCGLLTEI